MIRALLALALLAAGPAAAQVTAATTGEPAHQEAEKRATAGDLRWVPGELLVGFRPTATREAKKEVHARIGAGVAERLPGPGLDRVRLPHGVSVAEGLRAYAADPAVEVVEPNYVRQPAERAPNDERFGAQWGLRNIGQLHPVTILGTEVAGSPGADISVTEAWDLEQGNPDTIIAVIDDGVAIKHPDLAANVWTNPGEVPGNEVDDDDNGYIDDVHGWNFVHGNNKVDAREPPFDSVIHGTHVAGIVAAAFENGTGIAGVCPRCTIMPLKTDFSLAQLLAALDYARRMGADIVNGSYGGFPWSRFEYDALRALGRDDVLAVFAAGNAAADNDVPGVTRWKGKVEHVSRMYPASYELPHIVSVAASDHHDEYASHTWCEEGGAPEWRCLFSSWGAESRQLRAAHRRSAADLDRGREDARPPGTAHPNLRKDPAPRLPREPSRPTAVASARRKLPNDQDDMDAFRRHVRLPRRPRSEHQGLPDAPSCFLYVLQSRVAHDQDPGDELSEPCSALAAAGRPPLSRSRGRDQLSTGGGSRWIRSPPAGRRARHLASGDERSRGSPCRRRLGGAPGPLPCPWSATNRRSPSPRSP